MKCVNQPSSPLDCDGMLKRSSDLVKRHLETSASYKIRSWYQAFKKLYGMKQALPLPTTCDGIRFESQSISTILWCYFFGSFITHGTSAPLWISSDGSLVTVICPEDKLYIIQCSMGAGVVVTFATGAVV